MRSSGHASEAAAAAPTWMFSSTVRLPKSLRPSGTRAMPREIRRYGGAAVMSEPSYRTRPDAAACAPAIVRSSVVLPAPLAPTSAVAPPRDTDIDTPKRAWKSP